MMPITLHHNAILTAGTGVHIARATLATRRPKALHGQDFPEILWVQNGRVRLHTPLGTNALTEGDLIFLRPGQLHALQGRGEEPLVVALAFHPALVAGVAERHPQVRGHLLWSDSPQPILRHRDSRQLATLNAAALRLEQGPRDALAAEAFLLPLVADLLPVGPALPADAPSWLAGALQAAQDPATFRDGAAGLVRGTGRAHAHVSRTVQRYLGTTPSAHVNAIRMRHAAHRLTGSNDGLAEIAADCGIPNLSHFHKLFRETHGLTPAQYRQRHQRDMLQPDIRPDPGTGKGAE